MNTPNPESWQHHYANLYSPRRAAQLSEIPESTVRRWLLVPSPLWQIQGDRMLGFLDLVELITIGRWRRDSDHSEALRQHQIAARFFGQERPLASGALGISSSYLDWIDGEPVRWFPLGRKRAAAVDPRVNFGQPHVRGVPTDTLYESVQGRGVRGSGRQLVLPAGVGRARRYKV